MSNLEKRNIAEALILASPDPLPVARKVLGVFKSYSSRTWIEDNRSVCHSWFHIEDVKK